MWIEEVPPERLAEFFQHYHRALEVFDKASESSSWKETAGTKKNHLVAVAHLLLLGVDSSKNESAKPRQHFAEPGEAEWGC